MSSGAQVLVYNTRERALSTDFNREQAFAARARSQLARGQYNDKRQNWYDLPGVSKPFVGGETPLAADIFGGLMVDPQSTSLLITPGQIGCLFPDPGITADDSPYMLLDDPGLQVAGVLTFTANGGGGPRVDLVECQPLLTVIETDSRDIFNPTTGLFVPNNVPKVQVFRLQYRVRLGTPTAGLPALAAGWLPLAAIVTGTAAVSFADCDFYDVRPLVEDRVDPQPASSGSPNAGDHPVQRAEFSTLLSSGSTLVGGFAVSDFNGYVAGGGLRRSSPYFTGGTRIGAGNLDGDPNFINLSAPENQETGFAFGVHFYVRLVALFPGYLPRWVRYSQSAVSPFGRVPRGPRGIVVASVLGTGLSNGSAGLITTAVFANSPGVVLGIIKCNAGGTDFSPCNTQEKWTYTTDPREITVGAITGATRKISLGADVDFPAAAKAIRVSIIDAIQSSGGASESRVEVQALTPASVAYSAVGMAYVTTPDASTHQTAFTFDIPILGRATFDNHAASDLIVALTYNGSVLPISTPVLSVIGWKLGS